MIQAEQLKFRQVLNENENYKRELIGLHKTIDVGSRENEELKISHQRLQDEITQRDQERQSFISAFENKEKDIADLNAEIFRLKQMNNNPGNYY